MNKTLLYFVLTLVLFITGFFTWRYFYELSYLRIDSKNIQIIRMSMSSVFTTNLIFAMAMGALPIIYAFVEKLGKLKSMFQRITALAIVILMGIVSWKLRIMQMNNKMQLISSIDQEAGIQSSINIELFNFEIYPFIGFLIGGLLSILIFKSKKEGLISYGDDKFKVSIDRVIFFNVEFLMKMKKLIYIAIIVFTISCAKSKETVEILNEKDAYVLVNDFLIKELSTYHNIILFNNRHLRPPAKEETHGKLEPIPMLDDPFPMFTKLYWNQDKIRGVQIVEWEVYNGYFQKNEEIDMRNKWTEDFGRNLVYNVSYPIYNKQTKLAAIRVYAYASNLLCGTDLDRVYVYKKTKNGWKSCSNLR